MYNIDKIMDMLDCNNNIEIQKKGIELARNVKSINVFILPKHPGYNKNIWENCAKILNSKTDKELYPYVTSLLKWTENLNWPGAIIIFERIKKISEKKDIIYAIEEIVNIANAINKEDWLINLSKFLNNQEIEGTLSEKTLNILKKYYYKK